VVSQRPTTGKGLVFVTKKDEDGPMNGFVKPGI